MLLYGVGVVLGPAHMLLYINVIQILKIMVAAFAFYWFLSQFSFSVLSKMITSYAYALNGFLLVWGQHYQFGTVVIYFPLMLLFCEKVHPEKERKGTVSGHGIPVRDLQRVLYIHVPGGAPDGICFSGS